MQKYRQIISIYGQSWKYYSMAIVAIDQSFWKINKLVNELFTQIERDEDPENDP